MTSLKFNLQFFVERFLPSCILHHQPRVQRFQPADVTSEVPGIQIEVAEVDASHDVTTSRRDGYGGWMGKAPVEYLLNS